MAGGVFSTALLNGMTIRESATDGSDFTNPAADYRRLFLGEDGQLHVKDSAGSVTDIGSGSGAVATDTIWDAAGDLVVGSGANTAARLAIGATNGMAVMRVSGAVAWALPVGYEFDYVEKTSDTSITATAEASADTIVTGNAVTYDGSTRIRLEFWAAQGVTSTNVALQVYLFDGSSSIGLIARQQDDAAQRSPIYSVRYFTPAAATKTYSIRATTGSGTATIGAGAGGAATSMPAFIRISKA
jgi:hypothetical protein